MIRERLKKAYIRKITYADNRRRDLEFEVGDWVYLKISPMKMVMIFGKKGKLSYRYVGSNEIMKQVGKVAYELKLPSESAPGLPNILCLFGQEMYRQSGFYSSYLRVWIE